jgi:malonyl-CoA/methylmalonyl-CoA synthetase
MFFDKIQPYFSKIAIRDDVGEHTYQSIWQKAQAIASYLLEAHVGELQGARVAFQALPTADYVAMLWLAGGVAVPLSLSYPVPEVAYLLQNAQASYWLVNDAYLPLVQALEGQHEAITIDIQIFQDYPPTSLSISLLASLPTPDLPALMIYTSGTTGKPKGAVLTHENLQSQVKTLVEAWEWTSNDYTLHVLPLHHIHGVVNVLLCGLTVGATIDFLPKFEAEKVWKYFVERDYTLFMAVPTIYNRLIEAWNNSTEAERVHYSSAVGKMRLMVSGSAALPTKTLDTWRKISGHFLLERYGMTEIGMAISNPLHGERKAGSVGLPLAGVQVRIVGEAGELIDLPETAGEVHVRSKNIFKAYWGKPEATADSFTADGWFKTGDVARRDSEGYYYLLGRNSTDILKTGGYKVSALEVEEVLLQHPYISECTVVGLPDEAWGDKVVAVVVWQSEALSISTNELREWAKQFLAPYKVPMDIKTVASLPRNAMGKVVKKEVIQQIL